jgi:hypothetical protein
VSSAKDIGYRVELAERALLDMEAIYGYINAADSQSIQVVLRLGRSRLESRASAASRRPDTRRHEPPPSSLRQQTSHISHRLLN